MGAGMANQPIAPQFTDLDVDLSDARPAPAITTMPERRRGEAQRTAESARPVERRRSWLATIDTYLVVVLALLLAIGGMMVYSTTFDWSYQDFGSEAAIFLQHARNMAIGGVVFVLMAAIDYRIWRRLSIILLLLTIGSLIAVLLFGDGTFGARRAFLNGSYQPGELAELTIVIYMAAWLGSKRTKVRSFTQGLLPFGVLLGIIGGLVMLQPDLSTAATIFVVAGIMFFLAGADIVQLLVVLGTVGSVGYVLSQQLSYAQNRVSTYIAGLTDLTQTNYHAQQAIIAFLNGGWTGVGLGQGRQKFGFLPAPHTDSIFAVIGEELGIIGAVFVVMLYIVLIFRGLQIARGARDSFGALLASGITLWVATKALMNIAVMLNLLPSTGVSLPFISFGGSSLVVLMAGAGLLLSVARVTAIQRSPEGRGTSAHYDRGWGNRWTRVSGSGSRRSDARATPRR